MLRELMIKQHVGVVTGLTAWGTIARHRVFETGNPKCYLFCLLDPDGNDTTIHNPVRKADLKPAVRRALAYGCSFTSAAANAKLAQLGPAARSNALSITGV